MIYILGIISGLLLAILLGLFMLYFKAPMERRIKQIETHFKLKGSILEPENPELEQWKEEIKEN